MSQISAPPPKPHSQQVLSSSIQNGTDRLLLLIQAETAAAVAAHQAQLATLKQHYDKLREESAQKQKQLELSSQRVETQLIESQDVQANIRTELAQTKQDLEFLTQALRRLGMTYSRDTPAGKEGEEATRKLTCDDDWRSILDDEEVVTWESLTSGDNSVRYVDRDSATIDASYALDIFRQSMQRRKLELAEWKRKYEALQKEEWKSKFEALQREYEDSKMAMKQEVDGLRVQLSISQDTAAAWSFQRDEYENDTS